MTLKEENYQIFKDAFEKKNHSSRYVEHQKLQLMPKLILLISLQNRILKQFEPYGPQNMTPVFLTKNIKDTGYGKPMGQEDEHLKLLSNKITSTEGIAAIGFNLGNKI
jgi:single-stranded-DNA-specific exonuclease